MHHTRTLILAAGVAIALAALPMTGCDTKSEPASKPPAPAPAPAAGGSHDGHDHAAGDGHDHDDADGHDHDHGDGHDHGPVTQLGEQSAGGFTIKASRDGGVTPGSDAPVDVRVTGQAKVAAVRLWIGTQDAKGSVKAKAELEKDNWHTHVEIPKPLPEGTKLWVEIETDKGEKTVAGFDLKS